MASIAVALRAVGRAPSQTRTHVGMVKAAFFHSVFGVVSKHHVRIIASDAPYSFRQLWIDLPERGHSILCIDFDVAL